MFDLDFNLKGHLQLHVRKFLLYPNFWDDENNHINIDLNWHVVKFTKDSIQEVPEQHGLYCFVVKPNIASFFETGYLFYIGETQRTLRVRYKEYLRDQEGKGKPRVKVFEMLKLYKDYLYFYFAEVNDIEQIEENEEKLLNTFVPAINAKIPKATISPELKYIYE